MEQNTAQKLQTYIDAELGDAALYRQLAQIAPNEQAKRLLLEFGNDEQAHADTFRQIYYDLTGQRYLPKTPQPNLNGSYYDILRDRVLDESGDYRKYGDQYLSTNHPALRSAYYRARTDENVHALRLLYLLSM